MYTFTFKYDYRFDPFTEEDQSISISNEEKRVPDNSPFYIDCEEVPKQDSPSTVTAYDVTDGITLTEANAAPSENEFQVDYKYKTGKIRFNETQAGNTIRLAYKGTGHVIGATIINTFRQAVGFTYHSFDLLEPGEILVCGSTPGFIEKKLASLVLGRAFYTSNDTFTAPAGVTKIYISMIAGGGGGGGGTNSSGGGGGGGAGGYVIKYPYTVVAGSTYAITIGAAGSGGAINNDGTDGGNTTFDTLTVTGGKKGIKAGGAGGAAGSISGASGNWDGDNGASGSGGEGGAPVAGDGGNGEGGPASEGGGGGGGSPFGKGGDGGDPSVAGSNGSGYGSGGGGGGATAAAAGGNGGSGCIFVEW